MGFKRIVKNEKRTTYTGNGTEIRIDVTFEPYVIRIVSGDGNETVWTKTNGKTYLFRDSTWSSTISKYEITDGGISLDETNKQIVIGDNTYINENGEEYMILIFGGEE